MYCGVNRSSLLKWLLLLKLTASKMKYEKFGQKILNSSLKKWIFWCPNISINLVFKHLIYAIFKLLFTPKITLISMTEKIPLNFLDVEK